MNLWAFISLIAGLSHLSLGVYVLLRNYKRPLNAIFFIFALSLAIWGISEFAHRISDNPNIASIWIKISGLGWCFMVSFWVHFILIFAKKTEILKRKITYVGIYAPFAIIFYLFLNTDYIYKREPQEEFYGYTSLPGEYVWVYMVFYTILYLTIMYLLWGVMKKGTTLEKKQSKTIFWGGALFFVFGTLTNIIFPSGHNRIPELGTATSLLWAVSVFYAVIKHRLFIVEPLIEESSEAPKRYPLEKGHIYVVKEEFPDKGYEIFYDQITHENFGLCITKLSPDIIRQRYGLAKTPIVYSAFNDTENAILPKNINELIFIISDFKQKTTDPIFFIDCLDQIKFAIGFGEFITILKKIRQFCHDSNSILLASLNPAMFEEQQMAIVDSEIDEVETNV